MLIECERFDGETVELVLKCSGRTFEGTKNLAIEAIAAMLAADLGLPVPEPFIVDIDPAFVDQVVDTEARNLLKSSASTGFGSKRLPDGYAQWPRAHVVPLPLEVVATEVFVFDVIIVNADRRQGNPNCLFSGLEIAIFDHELSFAQHQTLFWKAPWEPQGFDIYLGPDNHIFANVYRKSVPAELNRFLEAWHALPEDRFASYFRALPEGWVTDPAFEPTVITYLKTVKANIESIVESALGALR